MVSKIASEVTTIHAMFWLLYETGPRIRGLHA